MTKDYLAEIIDLTGDSYLNPVPAIYDNGQHNRTIASIKSISVHHDASVRPHDYDSVALYHQEAAGHYTRLGPGLQYHYKIDNTGQIFHIRPLSTWLYCVGSAENVSTVAVCLDGNFETQQPTREQFEALFQLLKSLCTQHPEFPATWPDVRPHADFSSTACCGKNLRDRIYAIQDEATATAQLLNVGEYDWPAYQPHQLDINVPGPTPPASTVKTPPVVPSTPPPVVSPVQTPSPAPAPVTEPQTSSLWDWLVGLFNLVSGFLKSFKRNK